MAQQTINVGQLADDGTGDSERVAFQKVNANDAELYAHAASVANPHKVTAAQVDAFSRAETNDLISQTLVNGLAGAVTPEQLVTALDALGISDIDGLTAALAGKATPADIATAISGVLGGAPAEMDTFIEAYTRFVADEGAAAALTTLVGTKAPTNSPAFTGTPTAPTPAPGDNSTKLATTAFVAASAGTGTVTPTGTVADGDVALFNGTSGNSIKSGGNFALTQAGALLFNSLNFV